MNVKDYILKTIKTRPMIIDGALGTEIQKVDIPKKVWINDRLQGCHELLNSTAPKVLQTIYNRYLLAGADLITTNTFGSFSLVLNEYDISKRSYELSKLGAKIAKDMANKFSTSSHPRFVLGTLGPGTKLPSLGHIDYDEIYLGYLTAALGLLDGGVDIFLLETCQDPLQIKAALHACQEASRKQNIKIPIMVCVTIELSGTMLIGTDIQTIVTILEPFDILSLGFNCGTGPQHYVKHVKTLSKICNKLISVHANAGLPQNRGGETFYSMEPADFAKEQKRFLEYDGVSFLGGCCGTTPQHIQALVNEVSTTAPKPISGNQKPMLASLFNSVPLIQEPAPLLVGERSNATGSKAFRDLIKAENYEQTLSIGRQQVRAGAHVLDISVGFAGRNEDVDMREVMSRYCQKISLPLMPDSTQVSSLEIALKMIGGRAIINSANLEDGIEKFDQICMLAKKYGAALICLTIDEDGMAKSVEKKIAIAQRMLNIATTNHSLREEDLIFDLLTFTIGSGDKQYQTAAIETITAIRILREKYPRVGAILGLSNISFGLDKDARPYLNSLFLDHCIKAGLTSVILNVKHIIALNKISQKDKEICNNLLFNKLPNGKALFDFIEHFNEHKIIKNIDEDEAYLAMNEKEKISKLLIDGDMDRMLTLLKKARHNIAPEIIVNKILIDAMKVVGELFGLGQMQLPFVLQSAEVMKKSVDYLNPYLPKVKKSDDTTIILGTIKGDVHDVGKNLVDIILTNNGFKVINLGIKVDLSRYLKELKNSTACALGMSGLLVKSTQVMSDNLKAMKEMGITIPILLGGAALTRTFIDDFCKPNYDGPIFYCKDAFDGLAAMRRIKACKKDYSKLNTNLHNNINLKKEPIKNSEILTTPFSTVKMPTRDIKPPVPPFWGRKRIKLSAAQIEMAFSWINHKILFKKRWGYSSKGISKENLIKQQEEVLWPAYEKLKNQFIDENLFDPTIIYGYWPCRSDDNSLLIFNESQGYLNEKSINRKPLKDVIKQAEHKFVFPRQKKSPYRALSDFFQTNRHDVVALTCVSAGSKLTKAEQILFKEKEYTKYYQMHGLGVELAEALAEIAHKQIRLDLNISEKKEGNKLSDVQMNKYQGCRYSFGYSACPNLELNKILFDLLKPEEFGIRLSQTLQIHPEQSTSALVSYHPNATYYNI